MTHLPIRCCPDMPTVFEWGLIVMTLHLLTAETLVFLRRRVTQM